MADEKKLVGAMTLWELKFVYEKIRRYGYAPPMLDVGGVFSTTVAKYDPHEIIATTSGHIWSNIDLACECTHDVERMTGENRFATIVSTSTLEHCRNPFVFMAAAARLLMPGGMLFVSAPFMWQRHGDPGTDFWRFTHDGLSLLCLESSLRVCCEGDRALSRHGRKMSFVVASKGDISAREEFTGNPPI